VGVSIPFCKFRRLPAPLRPESLWSVFVLTHDEHQGDTVFLFGDKYSRSKQLITTYTTATNDIICCLSPRLFFFKEGS